MIEPVTRSSVDGSTIESPPASVGVAAAEQDEIDRIHIIRHLARQAARVLRWAPVPDFVLSTRSAFPFVMARRRVHGDDRCTAIAPSHRDKVTGRLRPKERARPRYGSLDTRATPQDPARGCAVRLLQGSPIVPSPSC